LEETGRAADGRNMPNYESDAWNDKMKYEKRRMDRHDECAHDIQYTIFKEQVKKYGHPTNYKLRRIQYNLALLTDPHAKY
jgi:hypothetical protein